MAGYRRVNYYELCRLCTSSDGTKMHIFREEGRRRSLPSKIQTCLPLQVQEEDSLPKIICSSCVDKLESYYEFRESCINAEAMLESYFTSLKYSDDLSREGKVSVYVKDEPQKKKDESTSSKLKVPTSNVNNMNNVPTIATDGNAIIPSAIQIVTDPEINRLTQYKVQVQNGIPSLVTYGEHPGLPISVPIPTLNPHVIKQQITSTAGHSRSDEGTQTSNEHSSLPHPPPLMAAVALAPPNQDFFQQLGLAAKDRNALTEVLKLKNVNILDQGTCESIAIGNPQIGSQITGQIPSLIPAQIRLDQGQLNQLISSNFQINFGQLQPSQTSVIQPNKSVIKNAVEVTQVSQEEPDSDAKIQDNKDEKEEKTTEENEDNEQPNNSDTRKSDESSKTDRSSKFEENGVEVNSEEETTNDETRQSSNNEENQNYECETCAKSFKRKEHLLQHKKSHTGERPFVCATCSKAFSRKEHLIRHHVSHTGQKLYTCDVCQKNFSRKDNLHKHKKTHGVSGPHTCEICGKSFVVKHYFNIHKAQHDMSPNTENSTGVSVKHLISTNSVTNPLPFKCDLCPKSFSNKSYLTSHRLRHRPKNKPGPQEHEPEQETQQPQLQQPQHQSLGQLPHHLEHQSSSEITIPQPTILTSFPTAGNINLATLNTQLTTINPNALLAPNLLHHSGANVVHIGNNSYLCSPNVTSELLEQYRRIHSS